MRRTFKHRLYPTRAQREFLIAQVDEACRLYNAALDERRSAWRMNGVSIRYLDQANQLKAIRAAGDVAVANFSACQDVLRRVDKTFAAFFRRMKTGEKAGYPRFRSRARYDSLTYPSWGDGCALRRTGRLYLQGVGDVKVKWHRALPADARIKTVSVKREAGDWYACFSLDLPEPAPLPPCIVEVGIDVGLTTFATLSDDTEIANPRYARTAARHVALAQRKLARRHKRSRRREKARRELAAAQLHVANQRRDFHHKVARNLVEHYGCLAVEDLNIQGLAGSMLAKSVHDAGWSQFLAILAVKAEEAGRTMIRVNPAGTTQRCSQCGEVVPKTLSVRWHTCPACGLSLGRDPNAARNVLLAAQRLGWSLQAPTVEVARAVA
jgi:putative transposase